MPAPKLLPASAIRDLRAGLPVALDPGVYLVLSTLALPPNSGQSVRGAGRTIDPRLPGVNVSGTALIWAGAPGKPMLTADGATNLLIADLSFVGRPAADAPRRAGPLVLCGSTAERGAAGWCFDRVAFIDGAIGVQFGRDVGESCASDSDFRACAWDHCGEAVRLANHQSVNHHFDSPGFIACGVALNVHAGGNVVIDGAGALQGCGWLLKSGGGGGNVFRMVVRNLRVENDLRIQLGAYRGLTLDNVQMSGPWGEYVAEVDPASTLALRDCANIPDAP